MRGAANIASISTRSIASAQSLSHARFPSRGISRIYPFAKQTLYGLLRRRTVTPYGAGCCVVWDDGWLGDNRFARPAREAHFRPQPFFVLQSLKMGLQTGQPCLWNLRYPVELGGVHRTLVQVQLPDEFRAFEYTRSAWASR